MISYLTISVKNYINDSRQEIIYSNYIKAALWSFLVNSEFVS